MLQAEPTKRGTGMVIYGDSQDLESLYDTIHHVSLALDESNINQKGQHDILMCFAYDLRKAAMGQREIKRVVIPTPTKEIKNTIFGVEIVWTDILIYSNALRDPAGFVGTTKRDQANIYALEHAVEMALVDYDPKGAHEIKRYIGRLIETSGEHAFILFDALRVEFILQKTGVARFRKIPLLINDFFLPGRARRENHILSLQIRAKELGCDIHKLEIADYPEDFKW